MPHSFEDDSAEFLALCNDEEQYSLWPEKVAVPAGWRIAYGPAARAETVDYIERNWTDMRPKSLRDAMAAYGGPSAEECPA